MSRPKPRTGPVMLSKRERLRRAALTGPKQVKNPDGWTFGKPILPIKTVPRPPGR